MRRALIAALGFAIAIPMNVSAQTATFDATAIQTQFSIIATQLTQILVQVASAQAQGTTYTQSAAFQTQKQQWLQQILTIRTQLVGLLDQLKNAPTTAQPTTPSTTPGYSTGSISATPVGGTNANLVSFTVTANPNATCSPTTFELAFGDGQSQTLHFPAGCNTQVQPASHTYASGGTFTAVLTSGSFRTTINIGSNVGANGGTPSVTVAPGSSNYSAVVSVTNRPGSLCLGSTYTLNFGDNATQTITFPASCSSTTLTFPHTYPQVQQYTIRVSDPVSNAGSSAVFTPSIIASAGLGNPLEMLAIETASGDTAIADKSIYRRTLSTVGVTTDSSFNLNFPGNSFITTGASNDFNFGTNPFTVELKFKASSFPVSGGQAALIVQSDGSGSDSSLGGAGLELYGTQIAFVGRIGNTTYHPYYNNTIVSTSTLAVNTWYHVALVRSGSTLTMYVNGTRAGSITVSGSANISSGDLGIGRYGALANNYFRGSMNGIHIYNGTAKWTAPFNVTTLSDSTRFGITTPNDPAAFRGLLGSNI